MSATASVRMLYVEDNRINAILFDEAMRMRGDVELRIAEDARDALELTASWTPQLLVLDAHLPDIDGYALLGLLRRQPGLQWARAWMCSADAADEDLLRAKAAGFFGYWAKPLNLARVNADIDDAKAALAAGASAGTSTPRS